MDGFPFYLPINIDLLVIIVSIVVIGIMVALSVAKRSGGERAGKDYALILRSSAPAQFYPIEPIAPPKLYQYKRESGDVCLLIADTPPIAYFAKKQIRNLFIGVEKDLVSLAINPESVDVLSSASEATKEIPASDIIDVVSYMLEKKAENDTIVIPPNLRVTVSYKYVPEGVSLIEKLLASDASIISTVIASLRAATAAKDLAQAVAIRAGAESRKWFTIAIAIVMVAIAAAILLAVIGVR
ncbi:MAG: hypothetical protein QXT67_04710 [Candidatus Bathyarchaeia archaeon]